MSPEPPLNFNSRRGNPPFKVRNGGMITLERETPRNKRLYNVDAEQRLLNAAKPHLHG